MSTRSWDDILDEDEVILWQGQPDPHVRFGIPDSPSVGLMLLFWLGAGAGWMAYASEAWPFGLIHLAIGTAAFGGALIWRPMVWRRTFYSLSNKRAYVATDAPFQGKRLRSFTLDADNRVTLEGGPLYDVNFATSVLPLKDDIRSPRARFRHPIVLQRHGFERLRDGQQVYHLIRDIQSGTYKGAPE